MHGVWVMRGGIKFWSNHSYTVEVASYQCPTPQTGFCEQLGTFYAYLSPHTTAILLTGTHFNGTYLHFFAVCCKENAYL